MMTRASGREGGVEQHDVPVTDPAVSAARLFAGPGEMRARCRALDWAATPLGPVDQWPASLRTAAALVLASAFPMVLLWGESLTQVYNDGYRALMGGKHPAGLGQSTRACWPEVWHLNAPIYARVRAGETVVLEDALFPITRGEGPEPGAPEDAWFTLSYSPVPDDAGGVGGVLVAVFETTRQVRARDARELERERLLAESEAARRQVTATLESIGDAFYAVDREFRFTYVNRKAEALWGRPRETLVGRHYWTEFPQAVGSEAYRQHHVAMTGRRPVHFETVSPILGRWIEASLYPDVATGGLACYFRDITERKAAEAARADAEERYHALFTAIDQGFCTLEVRFDADERPVDYRFLEVSPSFERQTGIVNGAGRWIRDIAPDQDDTWFERYGRVARTGESARFEEHSTPLARWWSVYAFRVGDPALRRVGVLFHDISDRKRADAERERLVAALTAEQELLRSLIRNVPAPVALHLGPEHRFAVLSDAFRAVSGGRDLTGLTPQEAYPEVVGHGVLERFEEVVAAGRPWISPETHIRFDRRGTGIEDTWFDIRYQPVRDAHGEVVGVLNFSFDVTDQVRARHEVERLLGESDRARADAELARAAADAERRRLALILDGLPVGVVVVDAAGAVVHVNPACDAVLGTSLRPVAALDDYPTYGGGLHPDGRPYAPDDYPIARAVLHGEVVQQELTRYRRGDGREVMVSISAAPVRDTDGRIAYAVAAVEDVSALEAARAAAEAANRAKGEFLAVMSHELRTPLNAIGGYAELVELGIHGPVTDAQRTALARIQGSQRHLLGLIAGVLDYSRLEAGAVSYQLVEVPVTEAVAEAEALVAPQLRAKGLGYAWSGAPPGLRVRADREKLQQILLNLLGNAVKFTDARDGLPGRIEVTCSVERDDGGVDAGLVRLQVRDTGEGIAADALERVFEPFVQVDQRLTRPHAGVGLGLAISRDLARGMGGELTVESVVGVGSTFTLTLPDAR